MLCAIRCLLITCYHSLIDLDNNLSDILFSESVHTFVIHLVTCPVEAREREREKDIIEENHHFVSFPIFVKQ